METILEISRPQSKPKIPSWIRTRAPSGGKYTVLKNILRSHNLHTVCEEAKCPNLGDCWSHGTATFMLMGDVCTRRCNFCSVEKGKPGCLDVNEPQYVANVICAMQLDHAVLTSVTRDDLPDQGAAHIAATIENIHMLRPSCKIEMLIPDFRGDVACVKRVVQTPLTVLSHNTETVPRLYKKVRPGAIYERTLQVLKVAKVHRPDLITKSGLMLGLGETQEELSNVFVDLSAHAWTISPTLPRTITSTTFFIPL